MNMGDPDTRPQKDWWAPGNYTCTCHMCGILFIGDKRAGTCSDCAYGTTKLEQEENNVTD